jgi:pyridinium-3,5-bisthiocarboxylic acid mononucleotide nickel chelatase
MKTLYLDCTAGIKSELLMGALINLGVDISYIENELSKLKLMGCKLNIDEKYIEGFKATCIDFSQVEENSAEVSSKDTNKVSFNYYDIENLINSSDLDSEIKEKGKRILNLYIQAKAKVNNTNIEDTIINRQVLHYALINTFAVLSCIAFHKPERIFCSCIGLGSGYVKTSSSLIPFPNSVIDELIKGIPVKRQSVNEDTVDEMGVCLLRAIVDEFTDDSVFIINRIGYGIDNGQKEFSVVMKVFDGEIPEDNWNNRLESFKEIKQNSVEENEEEKQYVIECNIDDMNSEHHDYVMKRLFAEGALDVYLTPIIMKKGRPAIKVSVLCKKTQMENMNEILFLETTTFGTRCYEVHKNMLKRSFEKVHTEFGDITIKKGFYKGKFIKSKPEYDECKAAAEKYSVPLRTVYNEVVKKI